MTDLETLSRVRISGGCPVERLVCHPSLPLVAGLDAERPAVHVWSCEARQLLQLGSVNAESDGYGDAFGWERMERTPAMAWHPDEPRLVVAGGECGVVQWTPGGLSAVDGVPPAAGYRSLAFGPDGRTLWASPSAGGGWESSDVVDLASGTVSPGPAWDTGVAHHPGGGLVATLSSDQGATHGLFARIEAGAASGAMRLLRRALILDVDGYETPLFSADGRHFAIRGNAYGNTLEVFAFPSLQRVFATTLGTPSPGYPYPEEWLDQMRAWSRHNLAFGARPGVLWVGTPTGTLVEVDVATPSATEHDDVLAGSPVTALAATAAGELVMAGGTGELALVRVRSDAEETRGGGDADAATVATSAVSEFLGATSDVPDGGDLEEHLVLTDGDRTWNADDLATVHTATEGDPTWLQLRAAVNKAWDAEA